MQLGFDELVDGWSAPTTKGEQLIELAGEVVAFFGPTAVARDLGRRNHANISYAVRPHGDRRGYRLYLEELPYFVGRHPDRARAAGVLAAMVEEPASDGERLAAVLDVIGEYLGPELRKGLLHRVNHRLSVRRARRGLL